MSAPCDTSPTVLVLGIRTSQSDVKWLSRAFDIQYHAWKVGQGLVQIVAIVVYREPAWCSARAGHMHRRCKQQLLESTVYTAGCVPSLC